MSTRRPSLALICAALLPGLLGSGCPGAGQGARRGGHRGPGGGSPPVAVAVEPARRETVRETLLAHATLEPESHVSVPVNAAGRVVEVLAEADQQVRAGQVLLRLDRTRAELALRQRRLELEQAKTSLARQEDLARKGLASKEELEQARQALALAQLDLERAQLDLADTELRSPIDGLVTERLVSLGDTLQAGAAAFRVADPNPLLARARVPESQAERLRPGQPALAFVDGRPQPLQGSVLRVSPLVDQESGTVVATVAFSGTQGIRLGRFARIEVVVSERKDAVTIPQDALALRGEEDRVLVCEGGADGAPAVVRQRTVVTGVRRAGRVEVREGLKAGERVVVAGPDDLREGARVRVVAPAGNAASATPAAEAPGSRPAAPRERRR
ncbi:MAG: efflux RND transporter periplasmic adaptor subunit [Planctomycetota bacterium]|nr:MAG: efflux RND transporter periplasmic adaptor subunit [Planctomycetota bacterium]